MVYKICKFEKPAIPLSAYANSSYFKLYLADVGLSRRMSRLPASAIFEDSGLYTEFKNTLTENYVLGELVIFAGRHPLLYFNRSVTVSPLSAD